MFMLADRPVLYPATTLLGNAGGPVVDTGIDLPGGGRVYLDEVEAGEVARHFDFAKPEEVRRLRARITELEEKLAQREARIRKIGELVAEATTT